MKFLYIGLIIVFFILPIRAEAAVVINEVAWMGTATSANDEWIELFNNGSEPVDLTGWTLGGVDGTPAITFSGSISANAYFLLERTDDNTVPDVTADQFFTGAIGNDAEILQLKDGGGVVVDSVDGSGGWAIGGNNTSKDTLQKSGSSWVTAPGTPKAQNANVSTTPPPTSNEGSNNTSNTNSNTSNQSSSSGGSGSVPPAPTKKIKAEAVEKHTVLVGADTVFEGEAYGTDNTPLLNARYVWNFGDGVVGEGKRVLHKYDFPGDYIVVLTVASGEFSASDRFTTTAVAAKISIPFADSTRIEVQNDTSSEVDLGRWFLSVANKQFSLPEGTRVPPNKKILISAATTKFTSIETGVTLHYPNGEIATHYRSVGTIDDRATTAPAVSVGAKSVTNSSSKQKLANVSNSSPKSEPQEVFEIVDASTSTQEIVEEPVQVAAVAESGFSDMLPWMLAVLAILGAGVAGVFLVKSSSEDQFEIIDANDSSKKEE